MSKFGLEGLAGVGAGIGLYIGLSLWWGGYADKSFDTYLYNFTERKLNLTNTAFNNAYFIQDYSVKARKYYTTYILGSGVDIASVPAPAYTDEAYGIFCLQLTGNNTSCRIRSGYNQVQLEDAAWYLIRPRAYRAGDGRVTAENIITRDLSAISASLGRVTGDGNPNDSNYKLVLSDGFSGNENKKGTLLLGASTDAVYLRRWSDFYMRFRLPFGQILREAMREP
jgi:hypothetical protein